jgi:hypothetical protein
VFPKPIDELTSTHAAGGEVQHEALLFIYRSVNVGAVEQEERCHCSVADALVAVDERMPLGKRKAERSGLSINVG